MSVLRMTAEEIRKDFPTAIDKVKPKKHATSPTVITIFRDPRRPRDRALLLSHSDWLEAGRSVPVPNSKINRVMNGSARARLSPICDESQEDGVHTVIMLRGEQPVAVVAPLTWWAQVQKLRGTTAGAPTDTVDETSTPR